MTVSQNFAGPDFGTKGGANTQRDVELEYIIPQFTRFAIIFDKNTHCS